MVYVDEMCLSDSAVTVDETRLVVLNAHLDQRHMVKILSELIRNELIRKIEFIE